MGSKERRAEEQLDYQSYLLRLWRVSSEQEGWRASLESAHTGERRGFATLDALFDYVRSWTRVGSSVVSRGEDGRQGRR